MIQHAHKGSCSFASWSLNSRNLITSGVDSIIGLWDAGVPIHVTVRVPMHVTVCVPMQAALCVPMHVTEHASCLMMHHLLAMVQCQRQSVHGVCFAGHLIMHSVMHTVHTCPALASYLTHHQC